MTMNMTQQHAEAVARRRRLLNHYDAGLLTYRPSILSPEEFAEVVLDFTRWDEFSFDTVMWDIAGGKACYPSKVVPHYPSLKEWLDDGNDFLHHIVSGSRDRGLEVFFSFRVNEGQDPNFDSVSFMADHEHWLVNFNEDPGPAKRYFERLDGEVNQLKWDYAHAELRDHQVTALRELVTNYDVDGVQLDFARSAPYLHVGHQWVMRDHLIQFMREVRAMMRQREIERSKPLLVAVRIAESLEGCHFDGIDIETWVEEGLIDLMVLGCRSFDVDLAAFKSVVASSRVKLYPCHDNHHSSDGYKCTPLRVLRGIASNWWCQGADGISVFNFTCSDGRAEERSGSRQKPISPVHQQDWDTNRTFLSEAGDPELLAAQPKTYAVQRRAGGAPWEFGYPEDGLTMDHAFQNANILATLPARLGQHGKGTTFLHVCVGEEMANIEGCIASLRVLISDTTVRTDGDMDEGADRLADRGADHGTDRIERGLIRRNPYVLGDGLYTTPLTRQTAGDLEVRINNIRLLYGGTQEGWLVYPVEPVQLARGANLLTFRLNGESAEISIEKIELDLEP
jgi:hypothetical protein